MSVGEFIVATILFGLSGCLMVLGIRHYMEKGFLMNNAWLYASKEQRETMNKKPYYKQSTIIFCILGVVFIVVGLSLVLQDDRILLFEIPIVSGAVSVESLHHFTKEEKIPLYEKVRKALMPRGFFIMTDYFAASEEEERFHCAELIRMKREQGIHDDEFYHYDTPLTVAHEKEALLSAGFSSITVLRDWVRLIH